MPGVRAHLGRAVALETATARSSSIPRPTSRPLGRAGLAADVARVADIRRLAALIVTMDDAFAAAAAHRTLQLDPATGQLRPVKKGWFW
jgi:hypothetical protein